MTVKKCKYCGAKLNQSTLKKKDFMCSKCKVKYSAVKELCELFQIIKLECGVYARHR